MTMKTPGSDRSGVPPRRRSVAAATLAIGITGALVAAGCSSSSGDAAGAKAAGSTPPGSTATAGTSGTLPPTPTRVPPPQIDRVDVDAAWVRSTGSSAT